MKKYIFIAVCVLVGFTSCENFFTTTLKVDPPEHEETLAVHAYVKEGDTVLFASVRTTVGLLENPNELTEVNDATVELFGGTEKIGTFVPEPDLNFQFYNYVLELDKPVEEYSRDLEIRVSHPNYPTASARDVMPEQNLPVEVEYLPNAGLDEEGDPAAGLEITINDPAGVENFYEMTLLAVSTFGPDQNVYSIYVSSVNPSISAGAGYEELLVSDVTFDGTSPKFLVTFAKYEEENQELVLRWNSITRSQYLYSKSIRAFSDTQNNGPFAEPVSVFSNMENGLGVFGLRTTDYIEIVK